jgi:aminoglycoside phosphotransferase (APT) family kinase protein
VFGVCPQCGVYGRDKKTVDPASSELICDECGGRTPFLQQPLFFVTGTGTTRSAVAWALMKRRPADFVPIEQDILPDSYELWMRFGLNVSQSGRPIVLLGTARPEQYENLPDRKFFGRTSYLALVNDEDESQWFKDNAVKTFPPMQLVDTTDKSVEETADEVEKWIGETLKRVEGHREYRRWVEERHREMKTSDILIDRMVTNAAGSPLSEKRRLLLGEASEVYAGRTVDGQELIIRIAHRDNSAFDSELWSLQRCRELGVPVPESLLVEHAEDDGEPRTFSIQRKIPGRPMDHLFTEIPIEEIHSLVRQSGRYLARIHSIKPEGYGWLGPDGRGTDVSPAEKIDKIDPKDQEAIEQAHKIGIDSALVVKAKEILIKYKDVLIAAPTRLVHGDYGGKHFIVHQGEIKGIVDFENGSASDPAFDLAWWHYWYETSVPTRILLEGYAEETKVDDDFELRIRLNKLSLAIGFMGYMIRHDHPGSESVGRNLSMDLDWFAAST